MSWQTSEIRQLAAKVERLERQNRRLQWLGIAGLAFIGALVLIGGANPTQAQPGQTGRPGVFADVAAYVLLKDDNAKLRGSLGAGGSGGALRLTDDAGHERALYNQEGIVLRDEKGKVRAVLAITKEGAKLELLDENGKVLSHLGR